MNLEVLEYVSHVQAPEFRNQAPSHGSTVKHALLCKVAKGVIKGADELRRDQSNVRIKSRHKSLELIAEFLETESDWYCSTRQVAKSQGRQGRRLTLTVPPKSATVLAIAGARYGPGWRNASAESLSVVRKSMVRFVHSRKNWKSASSSSSWLKGVDVLRLWVYIKSVSEAINRSRMIPYGVIRSDVLHG